MAENEAEMTFYYSGFWIVCNIGFATAQISHLSMIPELSDSDEIRTSLTLIRNSMVAFANILAFLSALIAFTYGKSKYQSSQNLTPPLLMTSHTIYYKNLSTLFVVIDFHH